MNTLQNHMIANIGASIANPQIDGQWHSGHTADGKGADKISYVGHYLPKGLLVRYRHHRQGNECFTWKEWEGQNIHFDAAEYLQRKAQAEAKAREAEVQAAQAKAALMTILTDIIVKSVPANHNHPYALGKRIIAIGARQATKHYEIVPAATDKKAQYITPDDLLLPVYSHTGQLQGIQQITRTGYKLIRGTFTKGLLWIGGGLTTGEVPNRLYVAEGWATAVAVHIRTRNPVIVAFAANNLLNTGRFARDRYPESELVFAVDNDVGSKIKVDGREIENPGKYYAEQAALAVDAAVITPPLLGKKADWNDWHISQCVGEKKPDCLAA